MGSGSGTHRLRPGSTEPGASPVGVGRAIVSTSGSAATSASTPVAHTRTRRAEGGADEHAHLPQPIQVGASQPTQLRLADGDDRSTTGGNEVDLVTGPAVAIGDHRRADRVEDAEVVSRTFQQV